MNRWMMNLLVAACLCAVACGNTAPQASTLSTDTTQDGTTQGGADSGTDQGNDGGATDTTPSPAPAAVTFELRLRGEDAGSLSSVRMRVKSVEVRAGATVLASAGTISEMDLATGDNAFLLTTFQVPAGTDQVEFTVALDSASVESASGNFEVDAGCEVLKLRGNVTLLAQRKRAVVLLDLARSFVNVGSEMMLVPHLQLVF
jgi:hypothetical protein